MTQRPASLKILVVCQYYHPEPFRITDICESLSLRGHDVTVLTGLPNYPEGEILPEYRRGRRRDESLNGVRIVRCLEIGRGTSRLRLFLNYLSFAASGTVRTLSLPRDFDVVFVNQLSPVLMAIPGIAYKKQHHRKLLLYCLDLWPASLGAGGISVSSPLYRLLRAVSRVIYRSADSILVTSSMFLEYFSHELSIDDLSLRHLPQYAEELFDHRVLAKPRDGSDADGEAWNFVFAGNIGDAQSVDTIVRAAHEVRHRGDIRIHIVGDGSRAQACRDLASDLRLTNIVFHGRRPLEDMPAFYRMADAMLVTLRREDFLSYYLPGKVQSYLAAGKPILGAADGETRKTLERSGSGYTCGAEDYRGLADAMVSFCADESKERLGANAAKFYEAHFSKDGFLNLLEEELRSLATPVASSGGA